MWNSENDAEFLTNWKQAFIRASGTKKQSGRSYQNITVIKRVNTKKHVRQKQVGYTPTESYNAKISMAKYCFKSVMSNPNGLLSQKLCHYLNQGYNACYARELFSG